MSKPKHVVLVEGSKYRLVSRNELVIDVMHNDNEAWALDIGAPRTIAAMMAELDAARTVLQTMREYANATARDVPASITSALRLHDRLCADREPPSE